MSSVRLAISPKFRETNSNKEVGSLLRQDVPVGTLRSKSCSISFEAGSQNGSK